MLVKFDKPEKEVVTFESDQDVYDYFLNCDMSDELLTFCGVQPKHSMEFAYDEDEVEDELPTGGYTIPINGPNPFYYKTGHDIEGASLNPDMYKLTKDEVTLGRAIWFDYPMTYHINFSKDFDRHGDITHMVFHRILPRKVKHILAELNDVKEDEIAKLKEMLEYERIRNDYYKKNPSKLRH